MIHQFAEASKMVHGARGLRRRECFTGNILNF